MKKTLLIFSLLFLTVAASAQDKLYNNAFPLSSVKLLEGPFKHACDLNCKVLLSYDVDRLLAPYLKEAGLPPKAESFSNWDGLDGHIGGHYLSAMAIHYASTGDVRFRERMDYMVSELKRCQNANGNGYVGGVPKGESTIWGKIKAGDQNAIKNGWVPWYNLHKSYAGLRDSWLYGGNEEAKDMFIKLCDWGITIISALDDDKMERMLATEFGGMNEVYADAYQISGDKKYLDAAKRFSHRQIYDAMKNGNDNLDNKHANTQVPKAVGYQRVAETSGDSEQQKAAEFFWQAVAIDRALSFGGNSRREHFPTAADGHSYIEEREGPETCNTNNMLKLTEGLFRQSPEARYADYYERAMFNHILSSQHPDHGGYVYFTPARPQHYRVYSAPNQAMWCCVGTGMENHGKYGEFIYTHTGDSLFVNLFVASTLDSKEFKIRQNTQFPYEEGTKITIEKGGKFSLLVRNPAWCRNMSITINGKPYSFDSKPSSYIAIARKWKKGDVINVSTPMEFSVEKMANVPQYVSILRGPIVMSVRSGEKDLRGLVADDHRWGHIAQGELIPLNEAPFIVDKSIEKELNPITGKPLHYTSGELFAGEKFKNVEFEPFFGIHDSRYSIYFAQLSANEYEQRLAETTRIEKERIALDNRTIDEVKPAEQQPEVDHKMKYKNSTTGNFSGESWRDATDGFFSYNLLTEGKEELALMVRYWGDERGERAFDILIDDQLLVNENISRKWNKKEFVNIEYAIPAQMLKGKQSVSITFRSSAKNIAGGIYRVRIVTLK